MQQTSGFEAVWDRVLGSYEGSPYGVIGVGAVQAQGGMGWRMHEARVARAFAVVKGYPINSKRIAGTGGSLGLKSP